MTLRQQKFVQNYLKVGNAKRAAIDAGYSEKTAAVTASKLLTNPNISQAVAACRAESASSSIADYTECCERLTEIARESGGPVAIKAIERLAKMRGYDTPVKVAPTSPDGAESYRPPVMTPDEAVAVYLEAIERAVAHGRDN